MLRELCRVFALRHRSHCCEHGDAGLAHRDHMGALADRFEELDQVRDVFVEAEPAVLAIDVAHVVPVGDEDVMLRQHGLHGAAQQLPRYVTPTAVQPASPGGCSASISFLKCSSVPKRRDGGNLLADLDLAIACRDRD